MKITNPTVFQGLVSTWSPQKGRIRNYTSMVQNYPIIFRSLHQQKNQLPVDLRDVTGLTPDQHNKVNNCNKGSHMNFLVSKCIPKTYLHILPSTKCNSSMFINNEQILIRKFFFSQLKNKERFTNLRVNLAQGPY